MQHSEEKTQEVEEESDQSVGNRRRRQKQRSNRLAIRFLTSKLLNLAFARLLLVDKGHIARPIPKSPPVNTLQGPRMHRHNRTLTNSTSLLLPPVTTDNSARGLLSQVREKKRRELFLRSRPVAMLLGPLPNELQKNGPR